MNWVVLSDKDLVTLSGYFLFFWNKITRVLKDVVATRIYGIVFLLILIILYLKKNKLL